MKLFLVTADHTNWDQWDSFVIRAENHNQAKKMAEKVANKYGTSDQKWSATEIKVEGKSEVILDSFRAG